MMDCHVLVFQLLQGASVGHLKQRLVHPLSQASLEAAPILPPGNTLKMH